MVQKMNGFNWEVFSKRRPKSEDGIVEVLLRNRGIRTKGQKEEFFSPPNPLGITPESVGISKAEINKSINRLIEGIRRKEKIIVYGDYDADGICAAAILWETLYHLGANALPYIPERISEGYGLNEDSIAKLKKEDPDLKLIVTVDHGIVGHKKIDFARELGLDVIVTDHHQPIGTKPKALAVVHTTALSGSGVAWMLAKELMDSHSERSEESRSFGFLPQDDDVKKRLELVAMGTIADLIPLVGPNRSLVKFGLEELRKTTRPGLAALMEVARVRPLQVGTYEVGFILTPRLNAMGRLEHAIESLRLLCTKDKIRAQELAAKLDQTNRERQQLTQETVLHTRQLLLNSKFEIRNSNLIFISHESYQQGVIGLVAGKLVDEFYRPAIVVARGETYSKASARSIVGFNIIETIRQAEELLVDAGGHPMAAGFTVETAKLEVLEKKLREVTASKIDEGLLTRPLKVDCQLELSQVTRKLAEKVAEFEPFGLGNPEPAFVSYGVEVSSARTVGGEDQHLKLKLKADEVEAIGFRMGNRYQELSAGALVDIAYNLSYQEWNGQKRLELKLRDLRLSKK